MERQCTTEQLQGPAGSAGACREGGKSTNSIVQRQLDGTTTAIQT